MPYTFGFLNLFTHNSWILFPFGKKAFLTQTGKKDAQYTNYSFMYSQVHLQCYATYITNSHKMEEVGETECTRHAGLQVMQQRLNTENVYCPWAWLPGTGGTQENRESISALCCDGMQPAQNVVFWSQSRGQHSIWLTFELWAALLERTKREVGSVGTMCREKHMGTSGRKEIQNYKDKTEQAAGRKRERNPQKNLGTEIDTWFIRRIKVWMWVHGVMGCWAGRGRGGFKMCPHSVKSINSRVYDDL